MNFPSSFDVRKSLRRGRGTTVLAVAMLSVVVASGCVVSEVTETRNGTTVTESASAAPAGSDVDPCGLDASLLEELSLNPADLVRGQGVSSSPTCTWEEGAYSETSLYYWVEGQTAVDLSNEVKTLDNGKEVEVFYDSPGMARYILRTDDLTLSVNYEAPASLEPSAPEGVAAVMDQLMEMYGG